MSYRVKVPVLLLAMCLVSSAAAQSPNLTYYHVPNFTYPVTPTDTYLGTWPVILPATLPGDVETIYWNIGCENVGTGSTGVGFDGAHRLDGEISQVWTGPGLAPANVIVDYGSLGPITVRGGRHTLELDVDYLDTIAESDETDNVWAHQFVFTPSSLYEETPVGRPAPPLPMGGTYSIVDGSPFDYNCDAMRFSSSGWWNAVTLRTLDETVDYDLELHTPSTGSEDGFMAAREGSYRLAGHLDAVIVNRNTVGNAEFDLGIINVDASTAVYYLEQIVSQPAGVGDSLSVEIGSDDFLRIWDTYIGDTGWVSVTLTDLGGPSQDFIVGWVEHDATELALMDVVDWEVSDSEGVTRFHREFTTIGYYGLVVFREPADGDDSHSLTLEIEPTPPDLQSGYLAGWHAPLVPSPVPIVPGTPAALPDTLYGYMPETYISLAMENNSPTSSPEVDIAVVQDDYPHWYIPYLSPPMASFSTWGMNENYAYEFPGGRHTLRLEFDHTETIAEIHETNNIWAEQYCWSPLQLAFGTQFSHSFPGDAFGSWSDITSGEVLVLNCDGYRLDTGVNRWEGMVLTQAPTSDYDLAVHDPLVGVKEGFDDFLISSSWLAGDTDYVLVNNALAPGGFYDIGVVNYGGFDPYTVEAVASTPLPNPVPGTHGPFNMPLSRMLHIHEVYLVPDVYAFRLDNLDGSVDWGLALHSPDQPLQGREYALVSGAAWLNGAGQDEYFTVAINDAGWYGLTVFKAGPLEFDKDGTYRLRILQGLSGVPDQNDLPAATALTGVHPNPFNPRTTIGYDLAAGADVELDIYDLKGALVRRLVRESLPAGHHRAIWNGQDEAGRRVASGVYLARLTAGTHRDLKKMVMLK